MAFLKSITFSATNYYWSDVVQAPQIITKCIIIGRCYIESSYFGNWDGSITPKDQVEVAEPTIFITRVVLPSTMQGKLGWFTQSPWILEMVRLHAKVILGLDYPF